MRRLINPTFGSFTLFLWIASLCHSAPIRDKNKPIGFVDRLRKVSEKPHEGLPTKEDIHNNGSSTGGFMSPLRSCFFWEAYIHGPTGVASSNERSGPFSLTTDKMSPWSLLRKKRSRETDDTGALHLEQGNRELKQQMIREEERLIVETSRQFVDAWSDFLCQGTISFGILRCEKEKNSSKRTKSKTKWRRLLNPTGRLASLSNSTAVSASSLMARFTTFPVKLLEFGNPVESSSPSFVGKHRAKESNEISTTVLCSWDIPLQGGGLVLEEDESQKQKSRSFSSRDPDCRGKLMFAIVKTTSLRDENKGGSSIELGGCSNSYEIITGIRNYRPWLAGGGYAEKTGTHHTIWDALQANRETITGRLCHGFYLSTQSVVHAYVTWRFHHKWKKELATALRTTTKTVTDKESNQIIF